jgi:hypothetical protein
VSSSSSANWASISAPAMVKTLTMMGWVVVAASASFISASASRKGFPDEVVTVVILVALGLNRAGIVGGSNS